MICSVCKKKIVGRTDKKFCSTSCRNRHHNKFRSGASPEKRRVNYILNKNRRILMNLTEQNKKIATRELLEVFGYNFRYHTHIEKVAEGRENYFCYDFGLRVIEEDCFELLN